VQPAPKPRISGSPDSSAVLFIAILSLGISIVSLYGVFFAERPLSASQREALIGISAELKSLQTRDITLSAPVSTAVTLDKSYPIKEMFPATFDIPIEFSIPVDTQLIAVSTTGQPVAFRVQESIPIKAVIPISSAQAFGNNTIRINKTMPVDAKFTSTVKIRAAYGTELNNIIDRLDALSGAASVSGN
jgi:hypothetical protein